LGNVRVDDPGAVERLKRIEEKWQSRWAEARVFEADPDEEKPKFFVTFPYPYVNAYPHLGGAFTILRVDITARYKRMKGYNVLFPQGWHATGGPIVASALRVKERDPKIIRTLKSMGVSEEEIPKFEDPAYWVFYFSRGWKRDLTRYGMSIDWRREFFTTKLNPYYSKFIEWQYYKLREKGFVAKGQHPVVWCPREKKVVGDHDRPDEYAGISPVEAVIIKFVGEDGRILPALTFRPETVFGVTNIWVRPDASYVVARVNGEEWVLSEYMASELADQGFQVEVVDRVEGRSLVGKTARNPVTGEWVPVLPASFVDPDLGTGVVMSVPAHAPYDYAALMDIKRDPSVLEEYGIDPTVVRGLEPIPLIRVEGYSRIPAKDAVEKRGVRSQDERAKLEDATKEIYSKEYHTGVLLEVTGQWAGMRVQEAKDKIIEWMVSEGVAHRIYTLPEKVYCRCGARTHVKIVSDQWFLLYNRPDWKELAHKAVDRMKFFPPRTRQLFHKNIDVLRQWAFTHKGELGTPLPWDPDWVIESLSDSTIYMAYYTIAKYTQHPEKYGLKPEQLIPEVFDYIFLGKGSVEEVSKASGIPVSLLEEMRREFEYWYPVDLRISGKDLIPNHLTFFIFHHTAIFPEDKWPRGIGVNGWVLVAGAKMSKSAGNFILLRQALDWWGADATRLAEVLGGGDATLDDANFEPEVANAAVRDLLEWIEFAEKNYGKGREERYSIDDWFESILNKTIIEVTEEMEKTNYKTALVKAFYNLQSHYRWYLRRAGSPHRELASKYIEAVTLMLAPFAPHTAEEVWERLGKEGFISLAPWPAADEAKIDEQAIRAEEIVKTVLEDAREVLRLLGGGDRLRVIVAAGWKYDFVGKIVEARNKGLVLRDAVREAISQLAPEERGKAGRLVNLVTKYPEITNLYIPRDLEYKALSEAASFLEKELGVKVQVEVEETADTRGKTPLPAKPALIVEKDEG